MPFVTASFGQVDVVWSGGKFVVECRRCEKSKPFGAAPVAERAALDHSLETRRDGKCRPLGR